MKPSNAAFAAWTFCLLLYIIAISAPDPNGWAFLAVTVCSALVAWHVWAGLH